MTFSMKLMDLQFFNRVRTHSRSIVSVHASVRYFDDDGEITQSMPLGLPTISVKECLTSLSGLKWGHSFSISGWLKIFLDFIPICEK